MIDWKVGQQVVCINDRYTTWRPYQFDLIPNRPKAGIVYTIRSIFPYPWLDVTDWICVHLEEIMNPIWPTPGPDGPVEPGFWSARFRPTKNTSIDVFEKMLKTKELEEV